MTAAADVTAAATVTLPERWRAAVPAGADPTAVERAGIDLIARWSEPARVYHTLEHLTFMLSIVDEHAGEATDPDAVRLAVWFHDAVYELGAAPASGRTNEQRSADLAGAVLPALGVTGQRSAEVVRLIALTADHALAGDDPNGALLIDADLAILGTPKPTYDAYARAIRAEYAFVGDEAYRAGRAAVLRQLLDLRHLYHLPSLRAAWEAPARANVSAELATLTVTGS